MTAAGSVFSCSPNDTVDDGLEMLVKHCITGLQVVDASHIWLMYGSIRFRSAGITQAGPGHTT